MYYRKHILGATGPQMYYMGSQMYHMQCNGALNVLYRVQRGPECIIWGPKCNIWDAAGPRMYYMGSQMYYMRCPQCAKRGVPSG